MATPSTSKAGTDYKTDSKITLKVKVLIEPKVSNVGDAVIGTVIDSLTLSVKTAFMPLDFEGKMKKDKFYLLKNVFMPTESLRLHKGSKIMQCGKFDYPTHIEEMFFNPPSLSVPEAICSPRKRRISITGELTDVSPVLETHNSRRKIIRLSQADTTIEVKLWGQLADMPTPNVGNLVKVTCVRTGEYHGKVDANSTESTSIEEIADKVRFEGEIEAVNFDMDDACMILKGEDALLQIDHTILIHVFPLEEFEENVNVKGTRQGTRILAMERIE